MASSGGGDRRNPHRNKVPGTSAPKATTKSSHTMQTFDLPQAMVTRGEAVVAGGQHVNLVVSSLNKGDLVWAKFAAFTDSKDFKVYPAVVDAIEYHKNGSINSVHVNWFDDDTRHTHRTAEQVFPRDELTPKETETLLALQAEAMNLEQVSARVGAATSAPRAPAPAPAKPKKKKKRATKSPEPDSSGDEGIMAENAANALSKSSPGMQSAYVRAALLPGSSSMGQGSVAKGAAGTPKKSSTGQGSAAKGAVSTPKKSSTGKGSAFSPKSPSTGEPSASSRTDKDKAPATKSTLHMTSNAALQTPSNVVEVLGVVSGDDARMIQFAIDRVAKDSGKSAYDSDEGSSSLSVSRALGNAFDMTDSGGAAAAAPWRPPPLPTAGAGGGAAAAKSLQRILPPPPPDDFSGVSSAATFVYSPPPVIPREVRSSGRVTKEPELFEFQDGLNDKVSGYQGMSYGMPKKEVKKRGGGAGKK